MATTMYEAIQEEGVAKGKVESIITILESRFSAIPVTLQKRLRNLRDDSHIVGLLRLAVTCQNLKEFQQSV